MLCPFSSGYNFPHEVDECLIPNCLTTTWNIRRKDITFKGYLGSTARLLFVFDSSQEVVIEVILFISLIHTYLESKHHYQLHI